MDYIQVGKITNTHGIKGELKIFPLTDNINRFDELKSVFVGEAKTKVNIEKTWYKKDFVIIKFKEFDDINQVICYKDEYIYIDAEDKVKLPENAYFIFDIIGCKVVDIRGNSIGIVKDVMTNFSNDIYVVKDSKLGKEYLIPAVKQFVVDVDIEDKVITIEPIEGLIE
ncbi:ribosome maturation factor RimM [Anaerosalibacter sp. Marseille-P3206]|uniref:ribosome maturation factor RimM n=1 Tax=Anaerosalibacter sp. Marseille-P3206 TaxID=1871005 RepID=UPI0009850DCB|nr:ribosome maturation factor RimM [Anaerosalibacter sp. Marseille-P3206]